MAVTSVEESTTEVAPFPHLVIPRWLEAEQAEQILDWFETEAVWKPQERSFYTQHSCFSIEELREGPLAFLFEPQTLADLGDQLRRHFGQDIDTSHVHVEAHRLLPGEGIGLHNDNPILGTEALRIVAHFNRRHEDRYGGHLVMFASEDPGDIAKVIRPLHNSAVTFPLGAQSFHAVTDVRDGVRYSLVLGFFEHGRVPVMHRMRLAPDGTEVTALATLVPDLAAIDEALTGWGAAQRPHGSTTLLEHVHAVAGLLARWGADPQLCRAALAHSAYGTQSIEDPLLTEADRPRLQATIGSEPERLVWAYCRYRFGEVYREGGAEHYTARTRDGEAVPLSTADVVALNLLAWANQFAAGAEVEIGHDSWVQFAEVLAKLEDWLPPACVRDLQDLTRVEQP
jgi:hypothetical protein